MPTLLCILDGWGYGTNNKYNAISRAYIPYWNHLMKSYPHCKILTSGRAVGLPEGQMGNSEVGHMTIGSGRIIDHSLIRINKVLDNIGNNKNYTDFIKKIKTNNGKCHVLGLLSPGGVHAHVDHIKYLISLLEKDNVQMVLHSFLDGRDTLPKSALDHLKNLRSTTICGRYYAMDRDQNLDRTKKAYDLIMYGHNEKVSRSAEEAINYYYEQNITDEFIPPTVIGYYSGIKTGDGILLCNFRPDRVRQILSALFGNYDFSHQIKPEILGMVEYSKNLKIKSILPNIKINNTLGELVSRNNMKQLRIAETEKYAHVTFFFNGGNEKKYPNEERILIPSPKVATYDLKPEMSAYEITNVLEKVLNENQFDLIVVNYANPDMVAHSGKMKETVQAIETIDKCLSKIIPITIKNKIDTIITADHGNAEFMYDELSKSQHTAHTTNPVPLIFVSDKKATLNDGQLSDIAPTILQLLNIPKPQEMTGSSIINNLI
ncbi:MAG: 2,3-bisphosphoglycerate-independent phosphoglycerate mutase [Rickettsiaceae bacterium H1]|nr:2,3-bisphosphoglycerate-independent phosphoglycerate mutase [Rickettsiaceae bacterium H1]